MPEENMRQLIATFQKKVRKWMREHPDVISITITLPSPKAEERRVKKLQCHAS